MVKNQNEYNTRDAENCVNNVRDNLRENERRTNPQDRKKRSIPLSAGREIKKVQIRSCPNHTHTHTLPKHTQHPPTHNTHPPTTSTHTTPQTQHPRTHNTHTPTHTHLQTHTHTHTLTHSHTLTHTNTHTHRNTQNFDPPTTCSVINSRTPTHTHPHPHTHTHNTSILPNSQLGAISKPPRVKWAQISNNGGSGLEKWSGVKPRLPAKMEQESQ